MNFLYLPVELFRDVMEMISNNQEFMPMLLVSPFFSFSIIIIIIILIKKKVKENASDKGESFKLNHAVYYHTSYNSLEWSPPR